MAVTERDVAWGGDSRNVIRGFPENVRWRFGRALYKAQLEKLPRVASRMQGRLGGIVELAVEEQGNAYRLYYTLKCPGRVYVLYCHKKKSRSGIRIPKHEKDLIARRFRDAMIDCEEQRE